MIPMEVMEAEAQANLVEILKVVDFGVLVGEVDGIVGHPSSTPMEMSDKLMTLASKLCTDIVEHTACGKGCNFCCSQAVTISMPEAKAISIFVGVGMAKLQRGWTPTSLGMDEVIDNHRKKYLGVACPFTTEGGRCGIYEVRPFACRTLFNVSDHPDPCDVTKGIQQYPALDMRRLWGAHAYAMQGYEVGDIREWFPDKGVSN